MTRPVNGEETAAASNWLFGVDMSDLRKAVEAAPVADRLDRFLEVAREGIRWHTVGGLPKADVVDRLHEIGTQAGLVADDVTEAIATAVADPLKTPKPNGATVAEIADYIGSPAGPELLMRKASDITPEPIRWLWPGRIALGKLTLLAGEPGLGKSQLTCHVAAVVTSGGRWPGDEGKSPAGSAVFFSAEDDAADTIRPRLDAAGALVEKVYICSAVRTEDGKGRRAFNLQADLALLEREVERIGDVRLLIIDPVSSYLGKVDSHRNAELRAVLEPIGELAGRLGVAVLAVTHLNKGGSGGANDRIIGSVAFVAAARAAFIVSRDPDDPERRLFLPTKNNLGPEGQGLGFRLGTFDTPSGIKAPAIMWDGVPVTVTANDVLATGNGSDDGRSAVEDAEEFLRELLAGGPVLATEVKAAAEAEMIAARTLRRAKGAVGIRVGREGFGPGSKVVWSLPD